MKTVAEMKNHCYGMSSIVFFGSTEFLFVWWMKIKLLFFVMPFSVQIFILYSFFS